MENQTIQKTNAGQGLGIAGLVLGILSFPLAFIPCVNIFAALVAVVGIVLSAIGLKQANKQNGAKGLNLAGLILSSLAMLVIVLWSLVFANIFSENGRVRREFRKAFKEEIYKGVEKDVDEATKDIDNDLEKQLQELEADTTAVTGEMTPDEFNKLLSDYEVLIKNYVTLADKASKNDLTAISEYTKVATKAASVAARLAAAAPSMSKEQMQKFEEVLKKYEEALKKVNK